MRKLEGQPKMTFVHIFQSSNQGSDTVLDMGGNGRIQEQNIEDLSDEVMSEMPIQHPIMYDTQNICEMVSDTKLTKFSVQMLQDIRSFYQLDIESISAK